MSTRLIHFHSAKLVHHQHKVMRECFHGDQERKAGRSQLYLFCNVVTALPKVITSYLTLICHTHVVYFVYETIFQCWNVNMVRYWGFIPLSPQKQLFPCQELSVKWLLNTGKASGTWRLKRESPCYCPKQIN